MSQQVIGRIVGSVLSDFTGNFKFQRSSEERSQLAWRVCWRPPSSLIDLWLQWITSFLYLQMWNQIISSVKHWPQTAYSLLHISKQTNTQHWSFFGSLFFGLVGTWIPKHSTRPNKPSTAKAFFPHTYCSYCIETSDTCCKCYLGRDAPLHESNVKSSCTENLFNS